MIVGKKKERELVRRRKTSVEEEQGKKEKSEEEETEETYKQTQLCDCSLLGKQLLLLFFRMKGPVNRKWVESDC